jgi:hypothetical protein
MKAAGIQELKQELNHLQATKLTELCLRLARFKKENKELLTYLLFEAHDTDAYIAGIKEEMNDLFAEVNTSHVFFAKKTLRKILRTANKYIRYSGLVIVEAELLLHFCEEMKKLNLPIGKNPVLTNLYQAQIKKINKALSGMHEDLQYEYLKRFEAL